MWFDIWIYPCIYNCIIVTEQCLADYLTADLNLVNHRVLALWQHKVLVLNPSGILIQIHHNPFVIFHPVIRALYQILALSLTDPAHLEPQLGIASDEVIFTRVKRFFGNTATISRFLDSFEETFQGEYRKQVFDAVFLSRGEDNYGQKLLDLVSRNTNGPGEIRTFFHKVSSVMASEKLLSATQFLSAQLPNPYTYLMFTQSAQSTSANQGLKRTQSCSII